MRFREFNRINISVNNEEDEFLKKIHNSENELINKKSLTEREMELARLMVSRGLLHRTNVDETTYYSVNN